MVSRQAKDRTEQEEELYSQTRQKQGTVGVEEEPKSKEFHGLDEKAGAAHHHRQEGREANPGNFAESIEVKEGYQ